MLNNSKIWSDDESRMLGEIATPEIINGTIIETKAPVVNISQFSPLDPNNSLSLAVKIISLGT